MIQQDGACVCKDYTGFDGNCVESCPENAEPVNGFCKCVDGFKLDAENQVCVVVEPSTCGPFEDADNNCECVANAVKIEVSDNQSAC